MASPSSSSSPSPPPLLPLHPLFSTIPEGEREEEDESGTPEEDDSTCRRASVVVVADPYQRRAPTPLHRATPSSASATTRATPPKEANVARSEGDDHVVSCNKCRPSAREKISVVPLDGAKGSHGRSFSFSSPRNSGVFRSFFSSLTWRSPRLSSCSTASPAPPIPPSSQEEWRLAATELSHKLIHATRKRDEALMEVSLLKLSTAELEKKLTRLENYCHDLKSALDLCGHANPHRPADPPTASPVGNRDFPLEPFLHAVSETRSAIRYLSRSLVAQIRQAGAPPKAQERILQLLQPYVDVRLRGGGASSSLLFYLEALLSRSFFEDFESAAFHRGVSDQVLDPRNRAQANLASYEALRGLSWEDVLSRGTRHYSEGFSRFCDRKMSEVAGTVLGGGLWGRGGAWPEPLLQAFFGAAKGVWLVHLLAWCDHPPVPVFRVDKGVPFDAGYMEDVAADRVQRLAPAAVRIMVAPGFYVRDSVVKCKVLCMYHKLHSGSGGNGNNADKVNNMITANHVFNDNNRVINRQQEA